MRAFAYAHTHAHSFLVGGASLEVDAFGAIIRAANAKQQTK
jgi:triosephosphate isomerase